MTELTTFQLISIILTVGGLVISLVSWLLLQLLNKQKEFQAMKDKYHKELDVARGTIEDTKFDRLIDKIEHLVQEIKVLFQKHDNHSAILKKQSEEAQKHRTETKIELAALRMDITKQYERCTTREAFVDKRLEEQKPMIGGHRASDPIGGHRVSDPCNISNSQRGEEI